jgi:hypothetical protein
MPASPIYEAFKRAHCKELQLRLELSLGKPLLSKMKISLSGKRSRVPSLFSSAYPGEGGKMLSVLANLSELKASRFFLVIHWSEMTANPFPQFGQFKELVGVVREYLGDREVFVTATLWHSNEEAESLFKPIDLLGQPAIFDSITGFTGVKKNPEGKLVYQLEVSFEPQGVRHVVSFTQTVKLSEDTPILLCETASRISALTLRPKEEQ